MGKFAAAAQRAPISNKRRPMVYGCLQERKKSAIRPVEGIRDVFFMKGAHIKRDPTTIQPRLFSLSDARIKFFDIHQARASCVARSVLEILKLTGAQDYASHFDTEEVALRRHRVRDETRGGATCMYARSYSPWHVRLIMSQRSLAVFAILVSGQFSWISCLLANEGERIARTRSQSLSRNIAKSNARQGRRRGTRDRASHHPRRSPPGLPRTHHLDIANSALVSIRSPCDAADRRQRLLRASNWQGYYRRGQGRSLDWLYRGNRGEKAKS